MAANYDQLNDIALKNERQSRYYITKTNVISEQILPIITAS